LKRRVRWGGAQPCIMKGRNVWLESNITSSKYEERGENEVGRVKILPMTNPGKLEANTRKKGLCNF